MTLALHRRAFVAALGLSVFAHLVFAFALGADQFIALLRPASVTHRPEPQRVNFELVETPQSAETETPPEDSRFMSNRNSRAQDQQPDEGLRREDQPRLEGEGKSHDLRQIAMAPTIDPMGLPAPEPELTPVAPSAPLPPTPEPMRPPAPEPSRPETRPEPQARVQPEPGAVTAATPPVAAVEPQPEPVPAPSTPPQPAPPVHPLPKKDPRQLQRQQVARLEEEIAALRKAMSAQPGRRTMSLQESNALANARVEGEFSYGATKHFFGDYLLRMKDRVERHWISLLIGDYTGILHSRAVIDFKIYSSGEVGNMHIVQNTGDDYFPVLCVQSLKAASPFDPIPYETVPGLPPELMNKPLNLRFTFEYN